MAAPTQFAINRSDLPLVEHAPTHDESPDVFVRLSQDLVVAVGLATPEALPLAPGFQVVDPLVDTMSSVTKGVLWTGIGTGDKAIKGHPDIYSHLTHWAPFRTISTIYFTTRKVMWVTSGSAINPILSSSICSVPR